MGARENGSLETKRVGVDGEFVASLVAELARTRGYQVQVGVDENVDLGFVEVMEPAELTALPGGPPLVAIVSRRLNRADRVAFRASGAGAILDRDAHLLDLLDVMSTRLFRTRAEERGYAYAANIPDVRYATAGGRSDTGKLLQASSSGAVVLGRTAVTPGTTVDLELNLGPRRAFLRGRAVCSAVGPGQKGFGVEFALDAVDVAPRLGALAAGFEPLSVMRLMRATAS